MTLYTVPSSTTTVVIGLLLCNIHTTAVTVDVQLVSDTSDTETNETVLLAKDVSIPSGSTLELLSGGKVVLQTTDIIKIDCSVSAKVDAYIKYIRNYTGDNMPFIGVQPATVPLTSSDITDGIVTTAKIADDAVGNTKLDLSANYAFTGTITGVGKVLQNVTADTTTQVSITSTTFTDSGLTASITPSSTSNKIAIFIHQGVYIARGGTGDLMGAIRLLRDSTVINQGYSDSIGGLNPYFALGTSQAMYFSYWNDL